MSTKSKIAAIATLATLVAAPALALDQDTEWPDPEPTPPGERPMSEIVIELRADERY